MKFKIFGIWFLLILGISCQKDELPASVDSSPEFTSSIAFNGENYTLSAGEMGLVQTSEYNMIGTEISMTGKLSNPHCDNCGPGFKLTVNSPEDYAFTPSSDLVSDLSQWAYSFNPISDTTFSLSMRARSGASGNSGFWFLNNEPLNIAPIDSVDFELPELGSYTLSFNSESGTCNLETSQTIDFDGQSIPCYGNIMQNDTIPGWFTAHPGSSFNLATTSYFWTFNDTTINTVNTGSLNLDSLSGISEMCVEMIDASGCSSTACTSFDFNPGSGSCVANILLKNPELIPSASSSEIAKMILEFTDNSGTSYSSGNGIQTNATISQISSENYTEPTMPDTHFIKVTYQINCLLFKASGTGYPFSGTIVTAFETP